MKKKIDETKVVDTSTDTELSLDSSDDAYSQINRTSFQQNFKVLIGHYKNLAQASQVG